MKTRDLKKIPNVGSGKKSREYTEFSKFEITFSTITIILFILYFSLLHSTIFDFFDRSVYVIICEFWVLIPSIYLFHRHFKYKIIENKFSLLFKDLSIESQIPLKSINSKFPNYDKEMILNESEFSNDRIISYIQFEKEIFKIKCKKEDKIISIFSLNTEDSHYPMYVPYKELENYDTLENLIYFYYKSIDYYQKKN
jgi:hypothetical protein